MENDQYQPEVLPLFIYYTPLPLRGLQLDASESNRTYLFVTSLDTQQARAKRSFDYGKEIPHLEQSVNHSRVASTERRPDQLWSAHVSRWNNVWSNGRIEVRGDDELQRQVNGALYYILSSLPPLSTESEHQQFYGLSPGSLSRGGRLGEDYGGHSFWDTETWMYPPVLMFYPRSVAVLALNSSSGSFRCRLAKEILSYRIALGDAAADNAQLFGYTGWR